MKLIPLLFFFSATFCDGSAAQAGEFVCVVRLPLSLPPQQRDGAKGGC